MPETKKIDSSIIYIENNVLNDFEGLEFYDKTTVNYPPLVDEDLPNTTRATIPEITGFQDAQPFMENDLLMAEKESNFVVDFDINEFGDLIVDGEESQEYSINSMGELLYNYN